MVKALKITFIMLILLSVFQISFASTTLNQKKSPRQKIEFETRDGFILVGDLYLANKPSDKPLIVCLHSFSMNASAWYNLAQNLRLKGYNVLAMDIRGHGRSVYNKKLKIKSRFQFTSNDWQKLPRDVVQSVNYIKANYSNINCNDIIIIGADIGASAGVLGAVTLKKVPEKMVLISPVASFKGLDMPVKSTKFYNSKILYLTTKTDRVFLSFYLKTPAIIKQYPLGGPGTQLIKANKDAINDIVNFIIN